MMGPKTIVGWWRMLVVAFATIAIAGGSARAQEPGSCWTLVPEFGPRVDAMEAWVRPKKGTPAILDAERLKADLASTPLERTPLRPGSGRIVLLPMPNGLLERFEVWESPVMEPELQARFSQFRTYVGHGLDRGAATLRLDLTPRGVCAQILSQDGTIRIDPYVRDNSTYHTSYFAQDYGVARPGWVCEAHEGPGLDLDDVPTTRSGLPMVGPTRRIYRIAIGATAEYTALQGGATQAMNSIVTLVNNLNGVYEIEANIRFVLVANENLIIYTNSLTDPYTNTDINAMLGENQGALDAQIGDANYDIGHAFGTANGGIANIGVVCTSGFKAKGVSASPFAVTDPYTVQTFCHEVGHQFNARHTFNGVNGTCTPAQRAASDAYEPGSGSALMSYASFCAADNVISTYGNLYLNAQSLSRINTYASGAFGSCAVTEATGNNPPSIDAGPDYTIPAFTPFVLTATGSDPDMDTVTYCWEERDLGPAQALAAGDTGAGPIIRSRPATTTNSRSFPALANLLAGTAVPGEIVPSTTRTLNFRVTARDNHAGAGGVSTDDLALSVVGTAGPFQITTPNTNVSWTPGLHTITWNIAGTNLVPISCATVRILYSVNGGTTFPTVLASGVPNTGSFDVTIPEGPTTQARIRVEAEGNIFFDVSDVNFTVPCQPPVNVVASESYCDRVDVAWTPVVGATGYSVWRGTTNAAESAALLGSCSTATFSDPTGATGTTYYYFVSTVAPTCTSGLSTPDSGSRAALAALGTVTASTTVCASVSLSWPAYTNATSYQVRRNTTNSIVGAAIVGSPTTNQFSDTTAIAGTTYFYFVRAQTLSCGFSPFAVEVQGSRKSSPPVPTGVTATDLASCSGVDIAWTPAAGATGYDVRRNTVNDALTATSMGTPASTTFSDTTAIPGTTYYYFVYATNPCGSSGASVPDAGTRRQPVTINADPAPVDVCPGEDALFTINAQGTGPLTYQWYVASNATGTNAPSLTLPAVSLADSGKAVHCEVTNACGTATSLSATLTVRVCGPDLFVDSSAVPAGNGAEWATAFQSLRAAIAYAATEPTITTLKVAAGTHTPDAADRDAAFVPRTGLTILGGYPPGGGPDASRDPRAHPVVLSGDLLGNDAANFSNRSDNSRRVLVVNGPGIVIDGVTVRGGHADLAVDADSGAGVSIGVVGTVTLRSCSIRDNQATLLGGGIHSMGTLTLDQSTVVDNAAPLGGGVAIEGVAHLHNSTISGNAATSAIPGEGGGGLLVQSGADADILECTIAFNSSGSDGGGVLHSAGTLSTRLSIIADNTATIGPDVSGDAGSLGHNLVGHSAGASALQPTDLADVEARLQALTDNGGPTDTHALGLYSRAIDAAPEPCGLPTDQRGVARPIAGIVGGPTLCDLGAFEASAQPPHCPADLDDGSNTAYPDGAVDVNDLLFFLAGFESGSVSVDLDNGSGTGTPDGGVDVNDLLFVLLHFEQGC